MAVLALLLSPGAFCAALSVIVMCWSTYGIHLCYSFPVYFHFAFLSSVNGTGCKSKEINAPFVTELSRDEHIGHTSLKTWRSGQFRLLYERMGHFPVASRYGADVAC
jgi:hypothetical protein